MWTDKRRYPGRIIALVGGVAIVAVGTAAALLAGHVEGISYTGCLATNGGTLSSIAQGDAPLKPCTPGQIVARLGSGDITEVLAGSGLSGGGSGGSVTLSLASGFALPQTCTGAQVAKWNGTGWSCAADNDTLYSAGTGLVLTGTQFSLAPANRLSLFVSQQADGVGIPDNITFTNVLGLDVPAGSFSITVAGLFDGPLDDAEMDCRLYAGATFLTRGVGHGHDSADDDSVSMMAVATFGAPTHLQVGCLTNDDGVDARNFVIQAIKTN